MMRLDRERRNRDELIPHSVMADIDSVGIEAEVGAAATASRKDR